MLGLRLLRLIEKHSEDLARTLAEKLRNSERTVSFCNVPAKELHSATLELYRHLGDWLLAKTESDIELHFRHEGERRASQGIPPSQLAWAVILSKENLWAFLQREAVADQAVELYGELELLQLLDQFFERALYYGLVGHEQATRRAAA